MSPHSESSSKNPESIKILRWWNMVFLRKGSLLRQFIHALISIALRLFFRRIETVNVEKVPKTEPIIFVLNHPNGLVDPALVFVSLPRRVSFLAKSTLFTIPVGGTIIRILEALPVYRRIDSGDMSKNLETFRACHELLAQNRCIAIFPEGVSHDDTKLKPIKSGAARIALGAVSVTSQQLAVSSQNQLSADGLPLTANSLRLKIMAVGLFYTSKTAFRSEVLLRYGEIFEVEKVELDEMVSLRERQLRINRQN